MVGVFTFILFSFASPTKMWNNENCKLSNNAFEDGERLVYKIYYTLGFIWIPAGEVNFRVEESGSNYEIRAIGKTYKSYNSVFKVNDYFYSKIDKETLYPKNFVRIIEEGNYRRYDSIAFDQQKNIALSYYGITKSDARPTQHQMDHCMHDMVSNIYYLRNLDTESMHKGDKFLVKMMFDKEVYPINIRHAGKEKKEIKDLGTFNTLKFVPDVVSGNVFKEGDKMTVWVSNDANKLPLLIETPVSIGKVKVVLKSYNGLRHKLDSELID
jgi:hypothetical protein